uniref:Tandem C2 domains, nuclear n=1 Tax=Pundamilia nyererei TaxID=303518 RepID=A0A3B4H328_9CICH
MECIKNCCKNFMKKNEQERETQGKLPSCTDVYQTGFNRPTCVSLNNIFCFKVIALKMPPNTAAAPGPNVSEDYLLSKMPPDGREVPFVVPTYMQRTIMCLKHDNNQLRCLLAGSARCTYAARKAELVSTTPFIYYPESFFHQGHMAEHISPGSSRRDTMKKRSFGPQTSSLKSLKHHIIQYINSYLNANATSCCLFPNVAESVTLSGDERELGKVCVRLNYQEALEQVWITLVQCSDLNLHPDGGEQLMIGFKSIITTPKPIQFKSSVREYCQDVTFMETFVFALHLQLLRCSALVLRLQTHNPKKRTVAECVLSLRHLGSQETEHWLELNPPSKSSVCHSELHLTTCFQPVNGRIQVQVLAAQNLPVSSSPLTQAFFVKVEMTQLEEVTKKKTRVLKASGGQCQWAETFHFHLATLDHAYSLSVKLYSRSSVRRKQYLGQLGLNSPIPEAVEQWKDTMAHPEKVVAAWHRLSSS